MIHITERPFGKAYGRSAKLFVLDSGALCVGVTDFGCTIAFIEAKDGQGDPVNTVLGYEDAAGYAAGTSSLGATVGRYAGRIGGARFTLNGREYRLEPNDGPNHLHGGFNKRFWQAEPGEDCVRFTLVSPDMDEGFPGELRVSITVQLENSTLRLIYEAQANAETHLNLTNHSYFNLSGGGTAADHLLFVNAKRFARVDTALIPTGELAPVSGTPMDHRSPRPLSQAIKSPFLRGTRGLDHSFLLENEGRLVTAARLYSPVSGIALTCRTTQPSVHVYTAGFADMDARGRFPRNAAVCLETQHLPDTPNKPEFPGTLLRPGERFREVTEFEFQTER